MVVFGLYKSWNQLFFGLDEAEGNENTPEEERDSYEQQLPQQEEEINEQQQGGETFENEDENEGEFYDDVTPIAEVKPQQQLMSVQEEEEEEEEGKADSLEEHENMKMRDQGENWIKSFFPGKY